MYVLRCSELVENWSAVVITVWIVSGRWLSTGEGLRGLRKNKGRGNDEANVNGKDEWSYLISTPY